MKKTNFFKGLLTGTVFLAAVVMSSSCKKNDVDEDGSTRIKLVHGSAAAGAQDFYLANSKVNSNLSYRSETDYIVTNSGNRLTAEFKNSSGVTFASETHDFKKDRHYTAFLAGEGQHARIEIHEDNLSAPSAGKAKVRFIHLSDAAPERVDIKLASGATLAANLSRNNITSFNEINTGLTVINIYEAGGTESIGNFNLENFSEGKIYTVYITGASSGDITVNRAIHN